MASPTREALEQEWQRLSRYHLDLRPAVLGPPEAFPDALAPLNPDLRYWPRVDPGRMREKSRAVALRIGLSFAGARRQPTTEEFYAAVHAEAPTEAQRCLVYAWVLQATEMDLIHAWVEQAYSWRQLVRALHHAEFDVYSQIRIINDFASRGECDGVRLWDTP